MVPERLGGDQIGITPGARVADRGSGADVPAAVSTGATAASGGTLIFHNAVATLCRVIESPRRFTAFVKKMMRVRDFCARIGVGEDDLRS
jgi:hypothetical protein